MGDWRDPMLAVLAFTSVVSIVMAFYFWSSMRDVEKTCDAQIDANGDIYNRLAAAHRDLLAKDEQLARARLEADRQEAGSAELDRLRAEVQELRGSLNAERLLLTHAEEKYKRACHALNAVYEEVRILKDGAHGDPPTGDEAT